MVKCKHKPRWFKRKHDTLLFQMLESNASVYWVVTPENLEEKMTKRRPNQRLSRIPGMYQLCNKVHFAILVRQVRRSPRNDWSEKCNFLPLHGEHELRNKVYCTVVFRQIYFHRTESPGLGCTFSSLGPVANAGLCCLAEAGRGNKLI